LDKSDFYARFCAKRFSLPSSADLKTLEEHCRVYLPADFRNFLLRFNGGEFLDPSFYVKEINKTFGLSLLFGCGIGGSYDLINNVDLFEENIPTLILPIGSTTGNSLLLLVTEDFERGSIRIKEPWLETSVFVAKDFDDFLELFQDE
jgi:hypothetical protein